MSMRVRHPADQRPERRARRRSVTPKISRGNSPRTTIEGEQRHPGDPLHREDVAEPVVLPAFGDRAHVHALEHPQEVARREHGADAADTMKVAEQAATFRPGAGLNDESSAMTSPQKPGEPRQPERRDRDEREDAGELRHLCDMPPPISAIWRVW